MLSNKAMGYINFRYDDSGRRTKKILYNSFEVCYYYDGDKMVSTKYGEARLDFFYGADGTPDGFVYTNEYSTTNCGRYYYVKNAQGDILEIINEAGETVVKYSYDAWGKTKVELNRINVIVNANPFRYRGYVYDSETGYYYLNSRYYDPEIGRFINADGYVSTGLDITGFNMFAYCGNNPVNRADPNGNHWYFLWIDDLIAKAFSKKNDSKNTTHEISYTSTSQPRNTTITRIEETDLNIYETGNGSNISNKINVEIMPNHVNPKTQKIDPNIKIYDSYKIRETTQQRQILQIVQSNNLYDDLIFTRTTNSYITEWKAHNLLYDLSFFSEYLRSRFGSADFNENEVISWDINW